MRYRDKAVHARNPEVLVAGRRRLAIVAAVVLVVLLAVGGWFLAQCLRSSQSQAGQGATTQMDVAKQKKHVVKKAEPKEHHGNSPDCPDTDCIAMMVNGDLLFHPGLWDNFAGPNTAATDGTAYDFTSLFEPMRKYIDASDIAVCEFETPIAPRGGPYTGYPVFNIPSEVADAAAKVGYRACTHASNHSWDQARMASHACGIPSTRTASPRRAPTRPRKTLPTAGHRFSDRWRQTGPDRRYRVPERANPRL